MINNFLIRIRTSLHNGMALEKFKEMMVFQGVDLNVANGLCYGSIEEMWNILLPNSVSKTYLKAETTGFIGHIDAQKVGEVCVSLGKCTSKKVSKNFRPVIFNKWKYININHIFQVQAEVALTLP